MKAKKKQKQNTCSSLLSVFLEKIFLKYTLANLKIYYLDEFNQITYCICLYVQIVFYLDINILKP